MDGKQAVSQERQAHIRCCSRVSDNKVGNTCPAMDDDKPLNTAVQPQAIPSALRSLLCHQIGWTRMGMDEEVSKELYQQNSFVLFTGSSITHEQKMAPGQNKLYLA